jgi:hypothetical protein
MRTEPPWTADEIAALERWQTCGWVHPFTCRESAHGSLAPTRAGWVCLQCDYRQDWAHGHMLQGPPPNPLSYFGLAPAPLAPTRPDREGEARGALAERLHHIAGCQKGSVRTQRIIDWHLAEVAALASPPVVGARLAPRPDPAGVGGLTDEIVRAAFARFRHEAKYPCSQSAMREAIELALERLSTRGGE